MAELKGSQTAVNLLKSFAGESQANMRYTMAAKQAKNDGFVQIQNIFEETARNEREHAKRFYKYLVEAYGSGEGIEIDAEYPVAFHTTEENLQAAVNGELEEADDLYPEFADIADKEGFPEIASHWRQIGKVEDCHAKRFKKLLENVKNNRVFQREEKVYWKCNNCGYICFSKEAPKKCPACDHPQSFFEIFEETY